MLYWLDTHKHKVSAATFESYALTVRVHILPSLGAIQVQKLTPETLQTFYTEKLNAGAGVRSVQLAHLHISQALQLAMKLGLIARNVALSVTPPHGHASEMTTWDAAQQRRFMLAAAGSAYGPIWIIFLSTGMRRGEVLGLRWQGVDWERGVLSIRQTVGVLGGKTEIKPPKTKSSRRDVLVEPEVITALREHKATQNARRLTLGALWQNHDLIFPSFSGTPINPNNLDRDYDRWVKKAGLPRIRIHDLRHSHVTLAIKEGANIKAVSQRVGHANVGITLGTYAHVSPEQHTDVSRRVGAALFSRDADAM